MFEGRPEVSEPIRVKPTSANSAESVKPVVLWTSENGRRRLAFSPNIHNNPKEPAACIGGELLYQSKRATGKFVAEESLPLTRLRSGQWARYKVPSDALLELYRVLSGIYNLYADSGVPSREYLLIPIDNQEQDPLASVDILADIIGWLRKSVNPASVAEALLDIDPENLRYLNKASAALALRSLLEEWQHLAQSPEPDWHGLLLRHEWVVQQVFGQPLVLFQDEAVVSSPTVDGKKAAYIDFMYKNPHTAAIALVEIKRADTPLLKRLPTRGDAYPPSDQLAAGVAQLQYYRATFQRDMKTLMRDHHRYLELASPRCVLVIGDTATLDNDSKRSSFERFRCGVHDVQIIAFDELRSRIEGFLAVVSGRFQSAA